MKQLFSIGFLLLFLANSAFAQKKTVVTDTIHVDGICDQCKKRIEDAAYIKGVKRADWNKDTRQLIVVFASGKTDLGQIEASIAKAGHNAGDIKALPADYRKLPSCCAYKDQLIDTH